MSTRQHRRNDRHEDTVVAYHGYLQQLIKDRLNGVDFGPGRTPFVIACAFYIWGFACLVVGILVIALRSRHVYLTGVWERFVGPLFLIFFLLSFGAATYFLTDAKRKANKYRRHLRFQPLGQFGVKVVHTTRLPHEKALKEEYKTGTQPRMPKPTRQQKQHPYHQRYGESNRGYAQQEKGDYSKVKSGQQREYGERGERYPPDVVPGRSRQYKPRGPPPPQVPPLPQQFHHEEDSAV